MTDHHETTAAKNLVSLSDVIILLKGLLILTIGQKPVHHLGRIVFYVLTVNNLLLYH